MKVRYIRGEHNWGGDTLFRWKVKPESQHVGAQHLNGFDFLRGEEGKSELQCKYFRLLDVYTNWDQAHAGQIGFRKIIHRSKMGKIEFNSRFR